MKIEDDPSSISFYRKDKSNTYLPIETGSKLKNRPLEKKIIAILECRNKILCHLKSLDLGEDSDVNEFYSNALSDFIINNLIDDQGNLTGEKKVLTHLGFKLEVSSEKIRLIFPQKLKNKPSFEADL
jgi:hypothetical protein